METDEGGVAEKSNTNSFAHNFLWTVFNYVKVLDAIIALIKAHF